MSGYPSRPSLFSRTLRECRKLYVSSGELIVRDHRELLPSDQADYVQLMDDLHKALALKVYLSVCQADREWSKPERFLGEVLCHHLWGQWLSGDQLKQAMKRATEDSAELKWYALVRPFDRLPPLRERTSRVETIVSRLANLVARCDGDLNGQERRMLKMIEDEIASHLREAPLDDDGRRGDEPLSDQPNDDKAAAFWSATEPPTARETDPNGADTPPSEREKRRPAPESAEPELSVDEALAELDALIGLGGIKHEVRSLANFLRLQQKREAAGLPGTDISLHMVFTGNPGTGKTTVARIVGKVFKALGVLAKGHLVETDRSGLVAEYAGQTGPKTNKCVDSALDGMLFIDEAYSLVAERSEDPYGREAAQALLKRAEDDRDRLVVILAGYPDEMQALLRSNPGLSSRFNRRLAFVDYKPLQLAEIFGLMCRKNRYEIAPAARLKVLVGFDWAYRHRDRHFGNGRAARNLFEHAVRRMANRLADDPDIDQQELVTLTDADIEFTRVPAAAFESIDEGLLEVHLTCPECGHSKDVPTKFLGKRVKCPKCDARFSGDWGELVAAGEG
ncbi:MAG: AAA family ATPase [Planctomycetota bacterium]